MEADSKHGTTGATVPSAAQIRSARGLLGWSQTELAGKSGVSRRTLTAIENGDDRVTSESIGSIVAVLIDAGLEFTGAGASEGVRRTR